MVFEQTIKQIMSIAEPILDELQLELVDLEYRQQDSEWILRFFIDKEGGVNLDDCAVFSRELSAVLDVEEVITVVYRLEVSSPGMDRIIKKDADFERFKGQIVRVKTLVALDPDGRGCRRKTFVGELLGLEQGNVIVYLQDQPEGRVELARGDIEKVNIEPQF